MVIKEKEFRLWVYPYIAVSLFWIPNIDLWKLELKEAASMKKNTNKNRWVCFLDNTSEIQHEHNFKGLFEYPARWLLLHILFNPSCVMEMPERILQLFHSMIVSKASWMYSQVVIAILHQLSCTYSSPSHSAMLNLYLPKCCSGHYYIRVLTRTAEQLQAALFFKIRLPWRKQRMGCQRSNRLDSFESSILVLNEQRHNSWQILG